MRDIITLACPECKRRNYSTMKNKNYHFAHGKKRQYKVEVKKFCSACDKQTPHKESK